MKSETKKQFLFISITEYKTLEKRLEKMSAKGWMLSEIKRSFLIFKKVEPGDYTFNVSLFYVSTPFDYPSDEDGKDYRALCEESGWNFCASNAVYQIFYKEKNQYAVPIHTDSREEYRIIKDTFKKTDLISMIMILFVSSGGLLRIANFGYNDLLRNMNLFSLVSPILLLMTWLSIFVPQIMWFIKNKANANNGDDLVFRSEKATLITHILTNGLLIIFFILAIVSMSGIGVDYSIIMIIPIALPSIVSLYCIKRFKTKKRTRKQNIVFFSVVIGITTIITINIATMSMLSSIGNQSNDKAPKDYSVLELSDFGTDSIPGRTSTREKSSMLVPAYIEYYESIFRKPVDEIYSVRTTYMECLNKNIANYIFNDYMEKERERIERRIAEDIEFGDKDAATEEKNNINNITEAEADLWDIDRGYYLYENKHKVIIQKDLAIYILDGDINFSENEIIEICKNKLSL